MFQTDHNKVKISVKKNEIIIDNFEMAKVVDEKNNFYKINAKQAIIDRTAKVADLIDFTLVYKKGETDMTAKADAGTLIDEVKVDVNGKIVGTVNDLDFETSKNGTFHYDFDTEIGVLTGNVVVNNVEGTILADKAIIYHNQNSVEFNGNVKVIYTN
ncbi:MAG: hypothetical protein C0603_01715 [Denitrovibrio sp.]|nr:MAG: hypothetical protein C0603_01715 [Denitrovibrio sp.]